MRLIRLRKSLWLRVRAFILMSVACVLTGCGAQISNENPDNTVRDEASKSDSILNETIIKSGALSGLYIDAGAGSPVMLIIPGSGPTDLNGNNPLGVEANTYKLLAEALAERRISTVRVDKRGMFSSADAGDPNLVTLEIYAEDYSNWVNTIRDETGAECVYVLGHSEGALMASAAAKINQHICGLILVSGAGRPLGDILRDQLKANPANFFILKEAFAAIEQLEAGERVETKGMNKALMPLFAGPVQDFLISIITVDPSKVAAQADTRTLIVQGETDIQTSVADAELLANATGGELVLVEGVNHVLKSAPLNRSKNMKTYSDPHLPISEEVVNAISIFIKR